MSPRRMDISSLLRDPSPPIDDGRASDRPRSIDTLHHPHTPDHPPASLLAILNSPRRSPPRPPFLGLDALVHVAFEERRRITAVSAPAFPDRDLPSLAHDHDRPSRHYSYPPPLHRHPDTPSPFQDNFRPHKRPRDTCPPEPLRLSSPESGFPLVPGHPTSPSTRLHTSASPTNNYPTLRPQPILHMDSTRSAPALLVGPVNSPSVSVHRTPPFLHSPHSLQSSPRNNSPHRHSPQHLRSQHHSPPIQTASLMPASADADVMPPRYGHGPRMAGGIQLLSSDSSSVRDPPRPDFSTYQSPRRDLPTERFAFESHPEHAKHEPPKLSPLSVRAFSLDDDKLQIKAPSHNVEAQETVFPRERVRLRPRHLPLVDSTTDSIGTPVQATDFSGQHPPERHPIRVWEESSTAREASRRVSPARNPGFVSDPTEEHTWSGASEGRHGGRPAKEDRVMVSQQDAEENMPAAPFSTCKQQPPCRRPTSDPLSGLQTAVEGTHPNPQPSLSIPTQSGPKSHPAQTLPSHSSIPRALASPVRDLETQVALQPERSETRVDTDTSGPLVSSDPIVTEPAVLDRAELILGALDANRIANPLPRQPSLEPAQLVPAKPGTFGVSTHSTHDNVSESLSRSSPQQPFPLFPAKDEHNPLPEDIPTSPPIQPEPASRRSSEPDQTTEREPPVSEQAMMDVDEELLSLVEDRPVRPIPAMPKTQIDSRSPLPITRQVVGVDAEQGSTEASVGPSLLPPSQTVLKGPLVIDEEKDRASMPPPAARSKKAEKDKTTAASTGNRKKKDGTSKPVAKPKQPPKPRAKPVPKPKAKPNVVDTSSKACVPKGAVNANTRSRSTSVIPGAVDDVVPEPEVDHSDKEDDKLYCVCKTRYDEDRMMIACDRCDEWFHTVCVNIPDLEIDLVDQFICPPCIQKHPHLRTTWKRRCLFGLQHENPSSPEACHKPSRGVFSKYCSDDCGIKYMQARIAQWEKSDGARDLLWESVKNAAKREGVVVCSEMNGAGPGVDSNGSDPEPLDFAAKRRAKREVARLNARLEEVVKEREFMKCELDMVMWREKVVQLASERAGKVDECGWDQRLCFGEEEWADFGSEVLESYDEERVKVESGDDAMTLDAAPITHGEWWCTGKKKCERHAGWQKLRAAEVSFDKETKEGILLKLTTREREIRKCIEDILYPQPTGTLQAPNPEVQSNGFEEPQSTGHVSERGRKRTT